MTVADRQFYKQLADNFPAALWAADVDRDALLYVSPSWEKLTGLPLAAGDALDLLTECVHPEDRDRVRGQLRNLPRDGADCEFRIVRPDGAVRWAHALVFTLGGANGKGSRIAGLLHDITERKERSLRAERLKDEFVATVSH